MEEEKVEIIEIRDDKDEIRIKIDKAIKEPLIDVTGYDGFNHRIWKIEDKELITSIRD